MLELKNISAGYGSKNVLNGVTVSIEKGKLTSIIGVNGCGKSTLLKAVIGILPLQSGEILIDGKSLLSMNKNGVAKPAVFDHFSESNGQIRIYVIKDGETKPGFFLFPQTKYVFPSKDDAQAHSDKEARQFGLSPSRTIVSAFSKKPKGTFPGQDP